MPCHLRNELLARPLSACGRSQGAESLRYDPFQDENTLPVRISLYVRPRLDVQTDPTLSPIEDVEHRRQLFDAFDRAGVGIELHVTDADLSIAHELVGDLLWGAGQ